MYFTCDKKCIWLQENTQNCMTIIFRLFLLFNSNKKRVNLPKYDLDYLYITYRRKYGKYLCCINVKKNCIDFEWYDI